MKKFLLIAGGGLLLLLAAAYVAVVFFLGGIVKAGVNTLGPRLTQSPVELASARLSPLTGTGTLSGLAVGNPAGWSDSRALYVGRVQLSVQPRTVFQDVIVIDELLIDQPEFNYETKIFSSNIKDLLKNIESFTGARDPAAPAGGGGGGTGRKFIVKKFRLTNAKATVGVGPTAVPVPLPPISLDDIGVAEHGVSADRLAGAIMREVLRNVAAGTAGVLTDSAASGSLDKAKEAAKQLGDNLKSLFKKKP